jgi:hypothetical protein
MLIPLFILLSKSLTYIMSNNVSHRNFHTQTRIISVIALLVSCKQASQFDSPVLWLHLLLNYNIIQLQRTKIHYFIFHTNMWYISGTEVFPARDSYVGSFESVILSHFFLLVYRFWCKELRLFLQQLRDT